MKDSIAGTAPDTAVLERLLTFVQANSAYSFGPSIQDDHLLQAGILDSLKMVEFLDFIEKEFKLSVSVEDLIAGKVTTLRSIIELIKARTP